MPTNPDHCDRKLPNEAEVEDDPLKRKILRFSDLALCGDEVWIEHAGKLYRLQSTRQGKLVLTK